MASSCIMARRGEGDLAAMAEGLAANLKKADLIYRVSRGLPGRPVILLVFEKYTFLNNNDATITVMFAEENGLQTADIICSGSATGLVREDWYNIDVSFLEKTIRVLEDEGFKRQDDSGN